MSTSNNATQVTVKRVSTDEANVSIRTVTYDIYVNGVYFTTCQDICKAVELKEALKADFLSLN